MYADKKLIEWVLKEVPISAEIARNTTLSENAIRNLKNNRAKIEDMRFVNAASLTEYAKKIKEKN